MLWSPPRGPETSACSTGPLIPNTGAASLWRQTLDTAAVLWPLPAEQIHEVCFPLPTASDSRTGDPGAQAMSPCSAAREVRQRGAGTFLSSGGRCRQPRLIPKGGKEAQVPGGRNSQQCSRQALRCAHLK